MFLFVLMGNKYDDDDDSMLSVTVQDRHTFRRTVDSKHIRVIGLSTGVTVVDTARDLSRRCS